MSICPIHRHLMAMPRTEGFKYYLPVYYDSCLGSEQSWGIKWDEPSRTKRKVFLLIMKWWLHTKWYFDIIIGFCVITFGLYYCFPAAQSSWYAGIYWVCLQRFHEIWEQVEQTPMYWYAHYLLCHEFKKKENVFCSNVGICSANNHEITTSLYM